MFNFSFSKDKETNRELIKQTREGIEEIKQMQAISNREFEAMKLKIEKQDKELAALKLK